MVTDQRVAPRRCHLSDDFSLNSDLPSSLQNVLELAPGLSIGFEKQKLLRTFDSEEDRLALQLRLSGLGSFHPPTQVAHCDHGCTRLDNNLMENAIRGSALGKKNFLFFGHPEAGDRSAIIYSIIASCARRQIDALANLRDVLSRLPAMTTADDLDALTPARWNPTPALVS